MNLSMKLVCTQLLFVVIGLSLIDAVAMEPFRITVVDQENGWPVPLVELRTTHNVIFVTDNAGNIAFDLPELMGTETWFTIEGHGYGVPQDGFGFRGVRLTPTPGAATTIEVRRQLAGKRLGRITGGGQFGESQKLGQELEWKDQGVLGCDSVQNAVHNGKLYWNWGDTILSNYPLGRFHMTGATTGLQPLEAFEPPIRLRYDYFRNDDLQVRDVAKLPGTGPTWLNGYCSLPDQTGRTHLVATYSKIKPPMEVYELGLCEWHEQEHRFEKLETLWTRTNDDPQPPAAPHGHTTIWDDDRGRAWVLFGDPFPSLKCPATYEAWKNRETWEQIPVQDQVPVAQSTESITPHRGAIAWNDYQKKWISIFTQQSGKSSLLGEVWYAEANAPMGPWTDAVHVVTHNKYSFYNPKLHPELTPAGSPMLLFEATYTQTFSASPNPTPKYDYNQILYRLDLNEMR